MNSQAEPAFIIRAIPFPSAAMRVVSLEVAISNSLVACILKFDLGYLKALFGNQGFALFAVASIENRHVRVWEETIFVANGGRWLDEKDLLFGHDFILDALTA